MYQAYRHYLTASQHLLEKSQQTLKAIVCLDNLSSVDQIHHYSQHAVRQIDQIDRRVLKGESIPHSEKVFSIFEEHTEWVYKEKAGVPVELGVRVCVLEDQHQFILHHRVMWQESDIFGQARRQHSAVEACINNLEVRGLDRCLSYGRDGFERHVALSIVATNIHRIGLLLQRKEQARLKRIEQRKNLRLAA